MLVSSNVSLGFSRQASSFRFRSFTLDTAISSCSHWELTGVPSFAGTEFGSNWVGNIRSEFSSAPAKTQHIWLSFRCRPCVTFVCLGPICREMGSRWEVWVLSLLSWDSWNSYCREQRTVGRSGQSREFIARLLCFQMDNMMPYPMVCDLAPILPFWHEKI